MFFERVWGSSQWNRKGCRSMNMRMMLAVIGLMAFLGAEGKLAPPKIEDYTYVCQKCGKTTHYPASELEPRSFIDEVSLRNIAKDARIFVNSVSTSLLMNPSFVGTASARKS